MNVSVHSEILCDVVDLFSTFLTFWQINYLIEFEVVLSKGMKRLIRYFLLISFWALEKTFGD